MRMRSHFKGAPTASAIRGASLFPAAYHSSGHRPHLVPNGTADFNGAKPFDLLPLTRARLCTMFKQGGVRLLLHLKRRVSTTATNPRLLFYSSLQQKWVAWRTWEWGSRWDEKASNPSQQHACTPDSSTHSLTASQRCAWGSEQIQQRVPCHIYCGQASGKIEMRWKSIVANDWLKDGREIFPNDHLTAMLR